MISRRGFLAAAAALVARLICGAGPAAAEVRGQFFFAQIRYRGREWDPHPQFAEAMIEELELRTSVQGRKERRVTIPSDPDLFFHPFLYMAGKYESEPFTAQERMILRRFLTFGGFLLAEDSLGTPGSGFDRAFREEIRQILPGRPLRRLPLDHSVYRSFYLLEGIGGRQRVNPFLEGIVMDNWTPVIYCQNDLAGAWARDRYGRWINECRPGGELQRAAAFKAGINIIIYSLTSDYKKDLVHHPFIQKRQNSWNPVP